MDWVRLKERFPNSYQEIKTYSDSTGLLGKQCLYTFLDSKGYPDSFLRINQLKDYEKKLCKLQ